MLAAGLGVDAAASTRAELLLLGRAAFAHVRAPRYAPDLDGLLRGSCATGIGVAFQKPVARLGHAYSCSSSRKRLRA